MTIKERVEYMILNLDMDKKEAIHRIALERKNNTNDPAPIGMIEQQIESEYTKELFKRKDTNE